MAWIDVVRRLRELDEDGKNEAVARAIENIESFTPKVSEQASTMSAVGTGSPSPVGSTEKDDEEIEEATSSEMHLVHEYLDDAENHLGEAITTLKKLARLARRSKLSRPFEGQLESYIIPHLQAWIDDQNQPGSIAALKRIIDEEGYEDEDEPEEDEISRGPLQGSGSLRPR